MESLIPKKVPIPSRPRYLLPGCSECPRCPGVTMTLSLLSRPGSQSISGRDRLSPGWCQHKHYSLRPAPLSSKHNINHLDKERPEKQFWWLSWIQFNFSSFDMMTRSDSFDCYKCDCCHGVKCLVMSPPVSFDTICNCSNNKVKIEQ